MVLKNCIAAVSKTAVSLAAIGLISLSLYPTCSAYGQVGHRIVGVSVRHTGGVPTPPRHKVIRVVVRRQPKRRVVRHSEVVTTRMVGVRALPEKRVVREPIVAAAGGPVVVTPSGHGNFPHLHEAMDALIAADGDLRGSSAATEAAANLHQALHELSESAPNDLFTGRRQKAIDHAKHAVRVLESGDLGESDRLTKVAIGDLEFCLSR